MTAFNSNEYSSLLQMAVTDPLEVILFSLYLKQFYLKVIGSDEKNDKSNYIIININLFKINYSKCQYINEETF